MGVPLTCAGLLLCALQEWAIPMFALACFRQAPPSPRCKLARQALHSEINHEQQLHSQNAM
eukprot:1123746-Pelagomonas_calceolata.AAC.3